MDIFRAGRISSLNYEAGTARVTYEDRDAQVTQEMPLLSPYQVYWMPKVGDPVFVLHLPTGGEAGLILGRYWCADNTPIEAGNGLFRQDMERGGQCYIKHTEGGLLQIYAPNGIELVGDTKIIGTTQITGATSMQSTATIDGAITANSTITASGDVKGAGISLQTHTHTCNLPGTPTSAPIA